MRSSSKVVPLNEAPWAAVLDVKSVAARHARDWWLTAQHAYPANTLRAWRADWQVYRSFCEAREWAMVPAAPARIGIFVAACGASGKKPATIRRYLSTIALAHRVAKLDNPCVEEPVLHALKGLTNEISVAQRQAQGFGWEQVHQFLESAGVGLRATRERALICVAYDTMARRGELVAFNCGDFKFQDDGSGRAIIRRSKTDQAGEGHVAYLSPVTVRYVKEWLAMGQITRGAVFRRLIGTGLPASTKSRLGRERKLKTLKERIGPRLSAAAVAVIFKSVARHIKVSPQDISGHSIRVGATQDLLTLNIDLASVMQAGRWKSHRMPMRYGEHVMAGLGGMARAARLQGRVADRPVRRDEPDGSAKKTAIP
jgi:site-specific recombinase XerD